MADVAATEGVYVAGWVSKRRATGLVVLLSLSRLHAAAQVGPGLTGSGGAPPTAPPPPAAAAPVTTQVTVATTPAAAAQQGGTIHGTVVAGVAGKPGGIPLPGVSVTATNTLTGKKFTTATNVDGKYAMLIPKNGRYVVRVELAGFAALTQEVVLTGVEEQAATQGIRIKEKPTDFGMDLASRAAAAEAKEAQATSTATLTRGMQGLGLSAGMTDTTDASAAGSVNSSANAGASMPTLAGLGDSTGADSVAVSGQAGQTNGLANFSEDDIRQRIQDAVAAGRANGSIPQGGDPTEAIVGMLGGMMAGAGPGGPGGGPGGGGGRGGRGGGGFGGSGAFRNFNPAQPHGNIFYQGGNAALNSSTFNPQDFPHFVANPSAYSNRFGASIAGSPYIPGLTKPNTKQFVFLNLTGQRNLTAYLNNGRVPTALERMGNFSQSTLGPTASAVPVQIFNPATGQPFSTTPAGAPVNVINTPLSTAATNLLAYYPLPNINTNAQGYNYQTISNGGNNNVAINSRYVRTIGGTTGSPFGGFGGGRGGGGGGGRGQNSNAPPSLRQNINIGYNYSHNAQDNRNIFLPLGGATESNGNGLNVGYTIGYGRLSNSISVNWNRSNSETRNYFTDTNNNPSATVVTGPGTVGLNVPNQNGGFADAKFYNGLPSFSLSGYTSLSNATPSETTGQTVAYSDVVAWRKKKHNMRYGIDVRRVHSDQIGGNNLLGSYTFTGYATASPASQVAGTAGSTSGSGNGLADFLLGLPQSTSIQAGLYKIYLRENQYDWYVNDDWRLSSSITLNYGLRYEYFGPYSEKNGRLVNLTGISQNFTSDTCMTPNGITFATATGTTTCAASSNAALVNPDHAMYSPRFGFAWKLKTNKWTKDTVVRGGYGINYNTGQEAVFARLLSHQQPFSVTETNDVPIYTTSNPTPTQTGCYTTQSQYTYQYLNSAGGMATATRPATTANLTLASGFGAKGSAFGCSTLESQTNNYAVDKNYRLGNVQVYNLNLQRTIPLGIVLNVGYNGTKGSNLDVVGSPNATPSGVMPAGSTYEPFDYEESGASSRSNALVVSAQKRQSKGISLGATYTYSHAIDNASGVGGAVGSPVQNLYNLAAEEGNSSFDQRHNLTGNFILELPFGPNRAFFNKDGVWSHVLDGFSVSGNFTFASGTYYTPSYSGNEQEAAAGNTYQQRPNRVFGQSLKGRGTLAEFFNTGAFAAPLNANSVLQYGTASPGSIEGPGTVSASASLSRTVTLGDTRSFEARVTATNVFNTVQYSGINTTQNSFTFGQVTSAAQMRTLLVQARYRF